MDFNYNRLSFAVVWIWILSGYNNHCYAEPLITPTANQQISPTIDKEVSEQYRAQTLNMGGGAGNIPNQKQTPNADPLRVIYGDEGIAFPPASEVIFEPVPTAVPGSEPTEVPRPTATPWIKPGRCERNETTVIDVSSKGDAQRVAYDILFLSEDLIPLDPEEVYGPNIILRQYGPNTGGLGEVWHKLHSVPCLPYRIRNTDRAVLYDFGNNALKNYSSNQLGKGVYHPWIQGKLFGLSKSNKR